MMCHWSCERTLKESTETLDMHLRSICMFGEQVHYKLSGRPSSRVGPRWELGAWVGKMELTDDGAARGPVVRRQYITQRWVDEPSVAPGCPRCEVRGTMSYSETCRNRFDARQLEEATRDAEPPQVSTAEMEVEQPQEHPTTGGASSSSDWRHPVRRLYRCQVPVLMRCGWKSLNRLAAGGRCRRVMRV